MCSRLIGFCTSLSREEDRPEMRTTQLATRRCRGGEGGGGRQEGKAFKKIVMCLKGRTYFLFLYAKARGISQL